MIDINELEEISKKPELFEPGEPLWEDEHISKGMLEAHLAPERDSASRNHLFIEKSAVWIDSILKPHSDVLDLGCGPGLYTERLAARGHTACGVDFSKRSIEFAIQSAKEKELDIQYIHQNYLKLDVEKQFDAALMIYCDFGVFSPEARKLLLQNVYCTLRPGGMFLFDVFTPKHFSQYIEKKNWYYADGGFWNPGEYLCMEADYLFTEEKVTVEQYAILAEDGIKVYRTWNKAYSSDELRTMLNYAGFDVVDFFSDVSGKEYSDDSDTMCVVAKSRT